MLSQNQQESILYGITTLLLSVFFLYFVLIGGTCVSLLQCRVQRYVTESLLFRHILIFLSILVFTFVLKCFSRESVFPQWNASGSKKESGNDTTGEDDDDDKLPEQQLLQWLGGTSVIYIFIVLLNKCEWQYFIAVALLLCVILVLFTFLKMYEFKYKKKPRVLEKQLASLERLRHSILVTFAILCTLLLYGVYVYYLRQYNDHKKHWDWLLFVFGGCNEQRIS